GLDTSVSARTLRQEHGLDVVAALVDVGQAFDLEEVTARAEAAGARLEVIDARERFAESFCLPALHANALYEGKYPLVSALARPPADAFGLTVDPLVAPDRPEELTVTFSAGRPVALDGEDMSLPRLIERVTAVGAAHGFGRVDMLENRLVGIKSRELYEVPGALALILAHRDLEDLTLERELAHEKAGLDRRWAELCYYGLWHGPLHASLRALVAEPPPHV